MAKKRPRPKSSAATASPSTAATTDSLKDEAIEAALSSAVPPALFKLCRLCETKDGPFLNIFASEQSISRKIDVLMPFTVTENDELPNKICFRCSAKVEELHEFVQRCISSQQNLRKAFGKNDKLVIKTKTRRMWEDKLNKSNMSNDEICNAVIEKAMAGIKDLPNIMPAEIPSPTVSVKNTLHSERTGTPLGEPIVPTKKSKPSITKPAIKTAEIQQPTRPTRSAAIPEPSPVKPEAPKTRKYEEKKEEKPPVAPKSKKIEPKVYEGVKSPRQKQPVQVKLEEPAEPQNIISDSDEKSDEIDKIEVESIVPEKLPEPMKPTEQKPPFDIMKHVSMIKVNGVGVLFQCSLCVRNFLNKEVVMAHGCAKTGVPKVIYTPTSQTVEPRNPITSVKYINNQSTVKSQHVVNAEAAAARRKPKAGPASRVKKIAVDNGMPTVGMRIMPRDPTPPPPPPPAPAPAPASLSSIEVPTIPGMKNRYKLLPGPNNTFTLVEDSSVTVTPEAVATKRRSEEVNDHIPAPEKRKAGPKSKTKKHKPKSSTEDIDSDVKSNVTMPYPVGLFQTMPGSSAVQPDPPPAPSPVTFTTPAMKKQSYTVVQTGNPSKLLISAKPQSPEEPPKPKSKRKSKQEHRSDTSKEPFNVTLEDVAHPKDQGFFTFINVDPLLQPSYVLPTDNIIQESQITSSAVAGSSKQSKDVSAYECTMCTEKFSREKKLLAHLQAHYNKLDEETNSLLERSSRRKSRKY